MCVTSESTELINCVSLIGSSLPKFEARASLASLTISWNWCVKGLELVSKPV
jgi:hypothetical protein